MDIAPAKDGERLTVRKTQVHVLGTAPLPFALAPAELRKRIVTRYYDRILAHRSTPRDVARIVTDISPIIEEASRQPQAQAIFRQMQEDSGASSLEEIQSRWTAVQEADILLESGGDPDARSSSDAVGVAQWLAGTATGVGLHVDQAESDGLTRTIDELNRQIAWFTYLIRPDADRTLPGAPAVTPGQAAQQLPGLKVRRDTLREKRRQIDDRYDARKSLFAQTRYLLRLYRKFPAIDWLFQAYHGGEGGVIRTLKDYQGSRWTTVTSAIRHGAQGQPLRFEDLYLTTKPRSHAEAFAYLFGRGDDHRHYWWKIRASVEILALYRRDLTEFQRQWEAHLPGRGQEALWYPDAPTMAITDLAMLKDAQANGKLLPVIAQSNLVIDSEPRSATEPFLAPEAKGLLFLLAAAFRQAGGNGVLNVGDMVLTPADVVRKRTIIAQIKARNPPQPLWPPDPEAHTTPGGGSPPDFDYHTAGIAFDLWQPTDAKQRKILDYTLGYCEDRNILWHVDRKDLPLPRYHILPNPLYGQALARIAGTGVAAAFPGI